MYSFICTELSNNEMFTLIASIAAALSALFSAIGIFITIQQNTARIKIKVCNEHITSDPQNLFNPNDNQAFTRIELQNLSSRPVTISDCNIIFDKKKYPALEKLIDDELDIEIEIGNDDNTRTTLHQNDFTRFPLLLQPYEYVDAKILFLNFPSRSENIIKGKIRFNYGLKKIPKSQKIILHKYIQQHIDDTVPPAIAEPLPPSVSRRTNDS